MVAVLAAADDAQEQVHLGRGEQLQVVLSLGRQRIGRGQGRPRAGREALLLPVGARHEALGWLELEEGQGGYQGGGGGRQQQARAATGRHACRLLLRVSCHGSSVGRISRLID